RRGRNDRRDLRRRRPAGVHRHGHHRRHRERRRGRRRHQGRGDRRRRPTRGHRGPRVTVTASTEAVEAANIRIESGVVDLTASDDGINASGNADLQELMNGTDSAEDSGATGEADTSEDPARQGGPGMFADTGERLEIAGGDVTIDAEGDGIDSNGTLTITGGEIVVYGPTRGGNGSLDANGGITMTGATLAACGPGATEEGPASDR